MVASIAGAVAVLALLAVVVGGLLSGTTLSVSGWPGDQPSGPAGTAPPDRPSPTATPRRTVQASRPPVASRTPTSSVKAEPRRTRTAAPTRAQEEPLQARVTGPVERPTTERPSTDPESSASAEPTSEPTGGESSGPEPTEEPTPTGSATVEPDRPGRGNPPGHDPGKTRGPKE